MKLQDIDRATLQETLTQLEQAFHNQQQWHNNLVRTFACRLPCDRHDLLPEAYKECLFGQWYYSNEKNPIFQYPAFIAIGESHATMHSMAKNILLSLENTNVISTLDYDSFANSLERLRLDVAALQHEIETLLYNYDPLTMAENRSVMLPLLQEQQALVNRGVGSCCIAMIDLDLFKKVNDQYGHLAGDKVLVKLARYFIKNLRPYDKIFRYGGEEFLLCIPQTDLAQALTILNRMVKEISEILFDVGTQDTIKISVSCGLTMLSLNYTIEQSIKHADSALYAAKAAGRNQVKVWSNPAH